MSAIESRTRHLVAAIMLVLVSAVSGCAHTNPRDPLEQFNRGVYSFNDTLDNVVLKPVATGYRAVTPQFVRTGVRNFFSNLDDVTVVINGVLQFKIPQALSDTGRFVLNSTVGLLGFIDVATHLGLEKHNEDFGQTLGYWGVGSGPYLVLPFLGPSSFRDGVGRFVDAFYTDVVWYIDHIRTRNILVGTRVVSNREALLDSEKILEAAALDRYSFIRDAYLQRRRNLVYDGSPPPEPEEEAPPPQGKPRSEAPDLTPTVLVDQLGNVVLAPAGAPVPILAAPAAAPSRATSSGPASDSAADGSEPAQAPTAQPAVGTQPAAVERRSDNGNSQHSPSRIVRVWLGR
ncbi:MAG: VacJ family lipoprotein [Betaproteobacteria bacterium]|nr:VacJ family lipoprotein [Betaproteobacteria bacterium]